MCVQFSKAYLPYVLGALTQLVQPTAWDVADASEMADVLGNMQDLLIMFGTVTDCSPCAPAITPPSGVTTAENACNIAGYLSNMVFRKMVEKTVTAIQDDISLIDWGIIIIGLIPGAGIIINGLIQALKQLYLAVQGGTLSHFSDAVADDTLWAKVTCAIYDAIVAAGSVTDANYPAVVANVCGIGYAHSDVVTALCDFVTNAGASGLEQMQQQGVLASYDCTGCATNTVVGPGGTVPLEDAGSTVLTILSGTAAQNASVVFQRPFTTPPVVVVSCADPVLIASCADVTDSGFTLTIAAAFAVPSDVTAEVFWFAVLPGGS